MQNAPKYGVNAYSTPHNSVYDDIEQVARTGGGGVGLFEGKFADGQDAKVRDVMAAHGASFILGFCRVCAVLTGLVRVLSAGLSGCARRVWGTAVPAAAVLRPGNDRGWVRQREER
jgi:hypothetical protein